MASPLDALQIELGKKAGKPKAERGEYTQEQKVGQQGDRTAGVVPEARPMNQGSVTRNGKKGRKL